MVSSRTGRSTRVGAEVGTKPIQSFTKAEIMGEQKLYISKISLLEEKENGIYVQQSTEARHCE